MGSKARIAKYIVPILQECINSNNANTYIEPFVGGANIIDKIKCKNRVGADTHKELIAMWQELQKGWKPPEVISEAEYIKVKDNKENFPEHYVGYVGFHATFGAKYFDGYARGFKADGVTPRILSNEAYRNTIKQIPYLKEVEFICCDYDEFSQIYNSVIYCDPPYEDTTKYSTNKFDYNKFWNWCREMSKTNYVYISSYEAPTDFKRIWQKETLVNFASKRKSTGLQRKRVEKLFIYKYGLLGGLNEDDIT